MTGYEVHGIDSTDENARKIVELTRDDLYLAGMPQSDVNKWADPDNIEHIERQKQKLTKHPERYLGAFACEEAGISMVGMTKVMTWGAEYSQWFDGKKSISEKIQMRIDDLREKNDPNFEERALGIFALVADNEEAIGELVNYMVKNVAEGREINIPVHPNDPAKKELIKHGFKPTGKLGKPIGDFEQELFVFPAKSK